MSVTSQKIRMKRFKAETLNNQEALNYARLILDIYKKKKDQIAEYEVQLAKLNERSDTDKQRFLDFALTSQSICRRVSLRNTRGC